MGIPGSANLMLLGGGAQAYQIEQSLRFNDDDSAYFQLNGGTSPTDGKIFTHSVWVKRSEISGNDNNVFGSAPASTLYNDIKFDSNDHLYYRQIHSSGGGAQWSLKTSARYRDPSAWLHIVVAVDTTQATSSDRVKMYVNGAQITQFDSESYPGQNQVPMGANGSYAVGIGRLTPTFTHYFDGYMTEYHYVDGTTHEPTAFGEYDDNGVWRPIEVTGITYGNRGWYLDFSDPNNIGADRSGNGNDFTPTGFELTDTTSTLYDLMEDSPTNNFATINPLGVGVSRVGTSSEANLRFITNYSRITGTTLLPKVKCYWEDFVIRSGGSNNGFGIVDISSYADTQGSLYYKNSGRVYINGVLQDGTFASLVNNVTTIGWTYDPDTDEVGIRIDNVLQGTWTLATTTGVGQWAPVITSGGSVNTEGQTNYGQRPFKYTPPAGFEPLSTAVQPEVAIKDPSEHFQVIYPTAANALTDSEAIFGANNSFTYMKARGNTEDGQWIYDPWMGDGNAQRMSATSNTSAIQPYRVPGSDPVAFVWNTTASGTNTTAGISARTWTGNGTSQNIAHGLGAECKFAIIKEDFNNNYGCYHRFADPGLSQPDRLFFNTTTNATYNAAWWTQYFDDTNAYLLSDSRVNRDGGSYVGYFFADVPGFSKFGYYKSNGSATDGPFVYLGFEPALVIYKNTSDAATSWRWYYKAAGYNPVTSYIRGDSSIAENTSGGDIDFLSNGFKIRNNNAAVNTGSHHIVYVAFAAHPFGGSNVSPSPAR